MNIALLKFLKLDLDGVKELIRWAILEGWNSGKHDAVAFYNADPNGFYGYFLENELIAGGSIVSYDGAMGFMGLFIVKPQYRNLGIGKKLWYKRRDKLLERLENRAPIGMDGVLAMQSFYQKGGFEILFKDERYERRGSTFESNAHISIIEETDLEKIISYDTVCFGVPRMQFLTSWLFMPQSKAFKYIEDGQLKGFVMIRKVTSGYKVCPLFADNYTVAKALYEACLSAVGNELIYIDIPVVNEQAVTLVRNYDAKYVFECARMYYGTPPNSEWDKVFGITTFELG